MNLSRYFRVQRKNVLIAKTLDIFAEEGIIYRMWVYRILTVNGEVVRKELLSYQDWCISKDGDVEQCLQKYWDNNIQFDEIIIK